MFQILQKINVSYFSVQINLFSNYYQRNGKTIGLNTRMCMIYIILNILQIVIVSYMFTTQIFIVFAPYCMLLFAKQLDINLFFLQDLYDLLSLNLLQIQNTRLLQLFHIILKILRTNEQKLFKSLVLIFLKKLNFN